MCAAFWFGSSEHRDLLPLISLTVTMPEMEDSELILCRSCCSLNLSPKEKLKSFNFFPSNFPNFPMFRKTGFHGTVNGETETKGRPAGRIRAGRRPWPGRPRQPGPGRPATALGLCSAVARGTSRASLQ